MSADALYYRRDIDGLRAIAVMAVIIFHAFPHWIRGGFAGVDVFFVISGYLISGILLRQLAAGNFSIAGFYARRIRRIFPALALVMAVMLGLGYCALLADEYALLGKHVLAGAGFVSNLVLWQEAGYFDVASETKPLLHLWSLGVEEQFYILWPGLLALLWRFQRGLLPVLMAVVVLSFAANIASLRYDLSFMFYSPITRFWELAAGSVLALLEQRGVLLRGFFAKKSVRHALSWLGLVLIAVAYVILRKKNAFPSGYALLPVMGACCFIAAGAAAQVNRWLLGNRLAVGIGLISFPLYLWHWPLLSLARVVYSATPPAEVRVACVGLSFALAFATYQWLEKPIRSGPPSRRKVVGLCAVMVVLAGIGGVIYQRDGLPQRTTIEAFPNNKNEMVRTPASDDGCRSYIGGMNEIYYCRYQDAGTKRTVAVIGDSHAHTLFPGMAEMLQARGYNLVMLASSSCPPLLGTSNGKTEHERAECAQRTQEILDAVLAKKDITTVYIAARGMIYMTGSGFGEAEKDNRGHELHAVEASWRGVSPSQLYGRGLAATVQALQAGGKKVYSILENPELGFDVAQCIARPWREQVSACIVPLATVQARQQEYRAVVRAIPRLAVIDPLPAMCSDDNCRALANGVLLYADNNHLSVAGSQFFAQHVLQQFLPK